MDESNKHAKERFYDRYGGILTPRLHEDLCEAARKKAKGIRMLRAQHDMRIEFNDATYRIVYDWKKDKILTFLPMKTRHGLVPPGGGTMRTQRIVFEEVAIHGTKRFECACGRRLLRRKKFFQTINPFNKYQGELKTRDRIWIEINAERKEWQKEADPCTHSNPSPAPGGRR